MPIHHAIGQVGEEPAPLISSRLASEQLFEDMIVREQPALVALRHADKYRLTADDPERAEYFVRVQWLDTVPENKAINEVSLFGNQNSVCQPTTPKWRHAVERHKARFSS